MENYIHIPFANAQNPKSGFDIIQLEELKKREHIGHSPFDMHLVEFYIILLFEHGVGIHTIDFTDYSYQVGTLLTIRKDQVHKFDNDQTVKGTVLLFTDDFLISGYEQKEVLKSLQIFNEFLGFPKIQLNKSVLIEVSDLLRRIKTEYFTVNDVYSLDIIRNELQILLTKLYRIKSNQNEIVHHQKYLKPFLQFQALVEQNASKSTKVKDYALQMGLSTKTLNTICKTIVHKSAKAFIDEIGTKQIKRLLLNTELSIKEIAYLSGFEEPTNFYKYFKRQTQHTPEQFRLQNK